jgi:hypothetical protein
MLADVNLITPVGGNQGLDRARIKRRNAQKHQRVDPKSNQHDAHNQEESQARQPKERANQKSKGLEVYA